MGIETYEVSPLFAEPFFRADIGYAISQSQVEFIKNLEMMENQANLISTNKYIFDLPELASIAEAVQDALDKYSKEIMGIEQKLYVTQSWSLINNPSIGMHGHSHSNSLISGSLYYTDLPDPGSGMIFDRHRGYQQIELPPDRERQNIFNTPMNIVHPKKNEIFLFSSGLQHFVETNEAAVPRYSIAFNTFIKGKIGDRQDVSELTLA
ncbi:MAG: putative 2OG-Fe(II) oxygenase [Woeseiaceae bacterium]|nr:putative 2OG-Fe(II) oxygenase [Woeseiaceae bacterium]